MSSIEFPDLLYPQYLFCNNQPHEILLDQWPVTTMDLTSEKKFVMQKIASPLASMPTFREATPPFTYSVAMQDLSHMNKYTLSTKYETNSICLLYEHGHLVYITEKNQLNIQAIPNSISDDLWSNTIEHLSSTKHRRHTLRLPRDVKLLDCTTSTNENDDENEDSEVVLTIALADQKGLSIYSYNPTIGTISTSPLHIETPDHTSILSLAFNPYIPSCAVLVDTTHRIYLLDDHTLTYLHQQTDEKPSASADLGRIFLGWDASPFLFTIADTLTGRCHLFDTRIRDESLKELFHIGNNHHSYLNKTELIRIYKSSIFNPFQHVFITDYSLVIIDSRMPNRTAIHSYHELLRPPTCFTQLKSNDRHILLINDEFNTNVLEYDLDEYRRLIQRTTPWETCAISNSRAYLTNNSSNEKQFLLAGSVYFDVPIRDMAVVPTTNAFLLFQLNSAGNIHVQLFDKYIGKEDIKTWNPDPDRLLTTPPDCFQQATDYWSSEFLPLFQCPTCLTCNVEPINFTLVTPLRAITHTSLRDFPTFKNEHISTAKLIPTELAQCPTCTCMPEMKTQSQLHRAQKWIQDWRIKLAEIRPEPIEIAHPTTHNWRRVFKYNELCRKNKDSTLWHEIHRPWWPTESDEKDPPKPPVE